MNTKLEEERAELLQRIKEVMIGRVQLPKNVQEIGAGPKDIRRRVLNLAKYQNCTPDMEFTFT
jgi:hypothetical protein